MKGLLARNVPLRPPPVPTRVRDPSRSAEAEVVPVCPQHSTPRFNREVERPEVSGTNIPSLLGMVKSGPYFFHASSSFDLVSQTRLQTKVSTRTVQGGIGSLGPVQ